MPLRAAILAIGFKVSAVGSVVVRPGVEVSKSNGRVHERVGSFLQAALGCEKVNDFTKTSPKAKKFGNMVDRRRRPL